MRLYINNYPVHCLLYRRCSTVIWSSQYLAILNPLRVVVRRDALHPDELLQGRQGLCLPFLGNVLSKLVMIQACARHAEDIGSGSDKPLRYINLLTLGVRYIYIYTSSYYDAPSYYLSFTKHGGDDHMITQGRSGSFCWHKFGETLHLRNLEQILFFRPFLLVLGNNIYFAVDVRTR